MIVNNLTLYNNTITIKLITAEYNQTITKMVEESSELATISLAEQN